MLGLKDVIIEQLQSGQLLIEKLTEDLSDAEYFVPPIEGANHVGWILGHMACSEDWASSLITGTRLRIPQSVHEVFKGGSKCIPDASKYPSRKEMDELFYNNRADTVEVLKTFDDDKWGDPSPEDVPRDFFPTLGSLWGMVGTHQFWHIGQITVCRAAMKKKPVLF